MFQNNDRLPEVLMFIGRFSTDGNDIRREVVECFTRGCCYWFAYILRARFGGEIMVDYVANHFGCRIDGEVYDITGQVTDTYKWERWLDCDDVALKKRIDEYCINF